MLELKELAKNMVTESLMLMLPNKISKEIKSIQLSPSFLFLTSSLNNISKYFLLNKLNRYFSKRFKSLFSFPQFFRSKKDSGNHSYYFMPLLGCLQYRIYIILLRNSVRVLVIMPNKEWSVSYGYTAISRSDYNVTYVLVVVN